MEIILLKDVQGLGSQFDTVTVKNGYGRNFLIPKKLGIIANRANKAVVGAKLNQINSKAAKALAAIEELVEKIKGTTLKVGAKVGTTEKIFGSVTNIQLADAIKRQTGIEIDRRKIVITEDIKTLGTYKAIIDFREDVKTEIAFEVVAE